MQVPIASSVAGVVGLANTREAKLHATGQTPAADIANQLVKPLEENTQVGDRDAQGQYTGNQPSTSDRESEKEKTQEHPPSMLDLPAEDAGESILDLTG